MLENIKFFIFNKIDWKRVSLFLTALTICLIIGFYIINKYIIQPSRSKQNYTMNNEFIDDKNISRNYKATLLLFYTEWCPYSREAMKHWRNFKDVSSSIYNTSLISFQEHDCDKNSSICDKHNIESYPKVKLINEGKVIDFEGMINIDTLKQFVENEIPNIRLKE